MPTDWERFHDGGQSYLKLEAERDHLLETKHWLYERWQEKERELEAIHTSKMWKLWMAYLAGRRLLSRSLAPVLHPRKTVNRLLEVARTSTFRAGLVLKSGWETLLAKVRHPIFVAPPRIDPTSPPSSRPRVLIVCPYQIYPPNHGGGVRLYNLIRNLSSSADLSLIVLSQDGADPLQRRALEPFCTRVEFSHWVPRFDDDPISSRPRSFQLFWYDELRDLMLRVIEEEAIQVVQLEYTELGQYIPLVPEDVPVILTEHDISFRTHRRRLRLGFANRYPESQNFCASKVDLRRIFLRELEACRRADLIHVMSYEDGAYLAPYLATGWERLRIVPNGVDCDGFAPPEDQWRAGEVLFVGNFQNLPNQDGLEFMATKIWPLVRGVLPDATLSVVGSHADDRTRQLTGRDGITLVGEVEDVIPYYQGHRVMVVPIRAGSGTRLKILEAFAAKIPVVSTTQGVEGIEARHGEHLLIADSAEDFARAICELLQHPERRRSLAKAAQELAKSTYDWSKIAAVLMASYAELICSDDGTTEDARQAPPPAATCAGETGATEEPTADHHELPSDPGPRPIIVHPFEGKPNPGLGSVLAIGIFMARKPNTAEDTIGMLEESRDWSVDQRWIALGGPPLNPILERHTHETVLEPTPKMVLLNRLLESVDLDGYEYLIIVDDDILLPEGFLDSFLGYQSTLGYRICQPARTMTSYIDIPLVQQHPGVLARRTRFVEQGPVISFHRSTYGFVVPFDLTSGMGWGLEYVWAYEAEKRSLPIGIIDTTPVEHSLRPPVEFYSRNAAEGGRERLLNSRPHIPPTDSYTILEVVPMGEGR